MSRTVHYDVIILWTAPPPPRPWSSPPKTAAYLPARVKELSDARGADVGVMYVFEENRYVWGGEKMDAVAQIRHKKWVSHVSPASNSRGHVGSAGGSGGGLPHLLLSIRPVNLPQTGCRDKHVHPFLIGSFTPEKTFLCLNRKKKTPKHSEMWFWFDSMRTKLCTETPTLIDWGCFCVILTELSGRNSVLLQEKSNPLCNSRARFLQTRRLWDWQEKEKEKGRAGLR